MTEQLVEGARIFIVDDQEPNVRLLEQLLQRAGFANLRSFVDGGSMLEAFGEDRPDLILLDLHMPALDGFAVLEALRGRTARDDYLPVLVLTADAERQARSRALAEGAKDFLVKPFDAEEVVLRVRNLLEARLLHTALRTRNAALVTEVAERTTDLQRSEAQWAAVTASLGRLSPLATPEATADAVCEGLATLPELEVVSIVAFGAGDRAILLARRSATPASADVNRALPGVSSDLVRRRVATATWFGPWSELGDLEELAQTPDAEVTAAALIPLRTNSGPVGVLTAAATGPDGMARLGRRVAALEAFAALAASLLAPGITERQRGDELRHRIASIISTAAFSPVFQPVRGLASGRTVGYEALTRFADRTRPDRRFADAAAVGMGLELEAACLGAAVGAGRRLPGGTWLALNVSPDLVIEGDRLARILDKAASPIVLEITEHAPVDDYVAFRGAIAALGPAVRCAIDDAGAGFASLRHILELQPDFVKLDIALVRAIERDPARQALVAGMVHFARQTGCQLIAEGIEVADDHDMLRDLGVNLGQGYLLGRPDPAPAGRPEPVRRRAAHAVRSMEA